MIAPDSKRLPNCPAARDATPRRRWLLMAIWMAILMFSTACGAAAPTANLPAATETGRPAISSPTTVVTASPTATAAPSQTATSTATLTLTPTRTAVPVGFVLYTVRSGDFLASLAARFGVPVSEISCADLLNGCPLLAGQPDPILPTGLQLVIPDALDQARPVGPGNLLIPDSEVIFSTASNEFNVQSFVNEAGGFLADHNQYLMVNGWNSSADIVAMVAVEHSISPRLLLALLEYQCGCVYAVPGSLATIEPFLGATSAQYLRQDLYGQLDWAVNQLSTGYYGWRHGQLTEMTLKDGSVVRLNPEINAGTAAVQYVFARLYGLEAWQAAIDPEIGFMATYIEMFGDPDERALPIFEPGDAQPELTLPFLPGKTWAYTGGPHPSYEGNGPLASLDFAPAAAGEGCLPTDTWVAAVADGVIVRSEPGLVMQDLDGDGDEQSGWNIMYLHIGEAGRVAVGEVILSGEPIGRPSCEGGVASGTHLHIARKYNGEWVPADSILPFVLSGWVAANGAGPYFGTLTREGVVLEACVCSWARSWIQLDG